MYIHLGGDLIIRSNKIIAILNYQSKEISEQNEIFLKKHSQNNNIVYSVSNEKPKSIIITDDKIYYSPISTHTLKRRAKTVNVFDEENISSLD